MIVSLSAKWAAMEAVNRRVGLEQQQQAFRVRLQLYGGERVRGVCIMQWSTASSLNLEFHTFRINVKSYNL